MACPAGRSARQHAVPADGKDGDQEATELSPRQGSVQQTDIDRTFPLNKVSVCMNKILCICALVCS